MSGNNSDDSVDKDSSTDRNDWQTKCALAGELRSQTWQFPDDIFLKRIISPRKQTCPDSLTPESFDYDVTLPLFMESFKTACADPRFTSVEAIPTSGEKGTYRPLARLLNRCVSAGLDALNRHAPDREQSLMSNLVFYEYDAETGDCTEGSAGELKPDIIGVSREDEACTEDRKATKKLDATAYWGAVPNEKIGHHIELVCEVKEKWREMVDQLTTYARSQFKACPSRTFVLTLSYNHEKSIARFIAFHRSGLTASEEFKLNEASGEKTLLRYIMGILWTEPQHAGFPQCITNERIYLPGKDGKGIVLKKKITRYHYVCVRGRATHVWEVLPETAPLDSPASSTVPPSSVGTTKIRIPVHSTTMASKRKQPQAGLTRTIDEQNKRLRSEQKSGPLKTPTSGPPPSGQSACSRIKGAKRSSILPFYGYELDRTGSYSDGIELVNDSKDIGEHQIKTSWQPSAHALAEKRLLEKAKGQFGIVDIDGQIIVQYANGEVQSTEMLTPTNEEFKNDLKQFFWDIHSMGAPPEVERRVQVLLVMKTKGSSLLSCKSTYEFFMCIKHALIGWLILFLNGCLHKDISIGNIMKNDSAYGKVPLEFTFPSDFQKVLDELEKRKGNLSGEDKRLWEEMQVAKDAIKELLKNEISSVSSCAAFVADADHARSTNLLWEDGEKSWEEPSGTEQFMSGKVIYSIGDRGEKFLQSPADDIESFFHVAIWAIFHNYYTVEDKLSQDEKQIKSFLLSNKSRSFGRDGYLNAKPNDLSSQLVKEAQPVMKEWHKELPDLLWEMRVHANIDVVLTNSAVDALWRRSVGWILCALSGIIKIVTIINSHLGQLKTCPDFDKGNPQ